MGFPFFRAAPCTAAASIWKFSVASTAMVCAWNFLTESTTIQPSGNTYFMPTHPWGLISLDWSVARGIWFANGRNKTNCEEVSTNGCRKLKAAGLAAKCFICKPAPSAPPHAPP